MPTPTFHRHSRMKRLLAFALGGTMVLAACRSSALGPETARAIAEARAFRATLVAAAERAPATRADTARLIALGYLERTRLGMGSPFRLADFALNDPRLPDSLRTRTAWAVLALVYDGQTYVLDAAVLDSLYVEPSANTPDAAESALRDIERTVATAPTPRAGELAIRLAYADAAAERLVRGTAALTATRAAAQLRDRALARHDLERLLRAAHDEGLTPVQLLPAWRMARRFDVERPLVAGPSPGEEEAAVARVPALLAELRHASGSPLSVVPSIVRVEPVRGDHDETPMAARAGPLLTPAAAARLSALPELRALPPSAPVVVALTASRDRLVDEEETSAAVRQSRRRFVARALTEESLVAGYDALGDASGRRPAEALLWAASALRTHAQETAWFPGAGGPSGNELRQRYGLASVTFDREVPVEWRPYYRGLLQQALEDLHRVLPAFAVNGLGVHFGQQPLPSALAVHDPRTRTVFLPLGTGPGAIAHELAHDLDWQVASRTLRVRGDYSTDQAVRDARSRLAVSLQGLTTAALVPPSAANHFAPPHAQRPTEVFAASVDWFVAAALARDGRMNGALSSVQDALLTGYAAVPPPDLHGQSGESMLEVLDEMTVVPAELERWYRTVYGREREPSVYERSRRVLELAGAAGQARVFLPTSSDGSALAGVLAGATLGLTAGMTPVVDGVRLPESAAPWMACVAREVDRSPLARARRDAAMLAAESVARRQLTQRRLVRRLETRERNLVTLLRQEAPLDPAASSAELRRLTLGVLDRVDQVERARSWWPLAPEWWGYC